MGCQICSLSDLSNNPHTGTFIQTRFFIHIWFLFTSFSNFVQFKWKLYRRRSYGCGRRSPIDNCQLWINVLLSLFDKCSRLLRLPAVSRFCPNKFEISLPTAASLFLTFYHSFPQSVPVCCHYHHRYPYYIITIITCSGLNTALQVVFHWKSSSRHNHFWTIGVFAWPKFFCWFGLQLACASFVCVSLAKFPQMLSSATRRKLTNQFSTTFSAGSKGICDFTLMKILRRYIR